MKILVVEDYLLIQQLIRDALEDFGAELIQATTLEEARKAFADRGGEIDLVVMDGCLGEGSPNTLELTGEIRRSKGPDFPIVAISGNPDYQQELLKAGCNHDALKPDAVLFLMGLVQRLVTVTVPK